MSLRDAIAEEIAVGRLKRHWTTADLLKNERLSSEYSKSNLRTSPPNNSLALPGTGLKDGHTVNPLNPTYYRIADSNSGIIYALKEHVSTEPALDDEAMPDHTDRPKPGTADESAITRSKFTKISKEELETVIGRDNYLSDPDVSGFTHFLFSLLGSGQQALALAHSYTHRDDGYEWQCNSLVDAALQYRFTIESPLRHYCGVAAPRNFYRTLVDNATVLDALTTQIRGARIAADVGVTTDAAIEIQLWGGTDRGGHNEDAIDELNAGPGTLLGYLDACYTCFGNGTALNLGALSAAGFGLRSNAGFSKIYSLCFDDFIIYDSRVAAALGMLITRYWITKAMHARTSLAPLPESLSLVWMAGPPGSERNPNENQLGVRAFPRTTTHYRHLISNVRANWMLKSALQNSHFEKIVKARPHQFPVTPLRALEAALFMIGYDLTGNWPY
jgi:hypothetical protein